MSDSIEMLVGLSSGELQVLADGKMVPSAQTRLTELLAKNTDGQLDPSEETELDRLLTQVDQLDLLKARAIYTISQQTEAAGS